MSPSEENQIYANTYTSISLTYLRTLFQLRPPYGFHGVGDFLSLTEPLSFNIGAGSAKSRIYIPYV